jgi:DNA-binding response OmpR family regulator
MEQRAPKILVVDDEAALADVLEVYLKNEGYEVLVAGDGRTAVTLALRERPDLVLLDLNLPKLPGLDAFREIRAQADIPVIMVTARGEEVDRVVGLELGADDYVAKPYSPREVVARVKSVLRRRRPAVAGAPVPRLPHDVVRFGEIAIDRTAHEVRHAGAVVKLTPTEYRLLGIFVDHPGQVFARDHLIELLSNDGGDVFDRTLDRHVANLRAKIEVDVQHPRYVITVYGVGYKMADVT